MWIAGKALVAEWAGLDRDGLHILLGLSAFLMMAIVLRRPLSSAVPWLAILVLCIADEIFSTWLDGTLGFAVVQSSVRDVAITMAAPTLILLLCRFVPARTSPKGASIRILLPVLPEAQRRRVEAIDAEFEEVPSGEVELQPLSRLPAVSAIKVASLG